MKVLLAGRNPALSDSDFFISGNVVYAPELAHAPSETLLEALARERACGLITHRRPTDTFLQCWSRAAKSHVFLSYVIGISPATPAADVYETRQADMGLQDVARALRECEAWFCSRNSPWWATAPKPRPESREVVLIGAGIVNLITALLLQEEGYRVTIMEASPAPGMDWHLYGCTHSGDDARMFSLRDG